MRILLALGLVFLGACGEEAATALDAGRPDDDACLGCHAAEGAAWQQLSSHRLILGCADCHATAGASGPGHAASAACAACHSEAAHPAGAACASCHEPHGTANAFLVRETLVLPDGGEAAVSLRAAEGASADGLVRGGVAGEAAGTGVCEVCHVSTRYYTRDGQGAPHETDWCPRCHRHENGFRLGLP